MAQEKSYPLEFTEQELACLQKLVGDHITKNPYPTPEWEFALEEKLENAIPWQITD